MTRGVDTKTLASMRSSSALYLVDPFYIIRPQTETVGGIVRPTAPARLGPYNGRFWPVSGRELAPEIAAARGHYRLAYAKNGAAIVESDRVEVAGRTYDVVWLPNESALEAQRVIGLED